MQGTAYRLLFDIFGNIDIFPAAFQKSSLYHALFGWPLSFATKLRPQAKVPSLDRIFAVFVFFSHQTKDMHGTNATTLVNGIKLIIGSLSLSQACLKKKKVNS